VIFNDYIVVRYVFGGIVASQAFEEENEGFRTLRRAVAKRNGERRTGISDTDGGEKRKTKLVGIGSPINYQGLR
jgi:hypothetical protein